VVQGRRPKLLRAILQYQLGVLLGTGRRVLAYCHIVHTNSDRYNLQLYYNDDLAYVSHYVSTLPAVKTLRRTALQTYRSQTRNT